MLPFLVSSQVSVGIMSGISNNHTVNAAGEQTDTKNENLKGTYFSVPFSYRFYPHMTLELPLTYLKKGYTLRRAGAYSGIYQSFSNSYLQLPMLIGYNYEKKNIAVFLNGGIYMAWWLNGRRKGNIPDIFSVSDKENNTGGYDENFKLKAFNDPYEFNPVKDQRFETGFAASSGVDYHLMHKNKLRFQISYFSAFNSMEKKYAIYNSPVYNRTVTVGLGYIYNFN